MFGKCTICLSKSVFIFCIYPCIWWGGASRVGRVLLWLEDILLMVMLGKKVASSYQAPKTHDGNWFSRQLTKQSWNVRKNPWTYLWNQCSNTWKPPSWKHLVKKNRIGLLKVKLEFWILFSAKRLCSSGVKDDLNFLSIFICKPTSSKISTNLKLSFFKKIWQSVVNMEVLTWYATPGFFGPSTITWLEPFGNP